MCESIKEFLVVRAGLVVLSSNIVSSQILNSFKNLWKLPLGVLITRHWELACYRKQTWLFTRGCSSYMQSSQQGGRLNMIITVLGEMVLVLGACAMICHVFVSMYLYMVRFHEDAYWLKNLSLFALNVECHWSQKNKSMVEIRPPVLLSISLEY